MTDGELYHWGDGVLRLGCTGCDWIHEPVSRAPLLKDLVEVLIKHLDEDHSLDVACPEDWCWRPPGVACVDIMTGIIRDQPHDSRIQIRRIRRRMREMMEMRNTNDT